MRTAQKKIAQFIDIKYGEYISNKLSNKTTVTIPPPVYSAAIMLRHQEWEKHVRKKQVNIKAAMGAKLVQLQAASIQDAVAIAEVKNDIQDIEYQQGQEIHTISLIPRGSSSAARARHTVTGLLFWISIVVMCMH